MISATISADELRKALAALDTASANGFPATLAVLRLDSVGRVPEECCMVFDGSVILRVKPDDDVTNYGRFSAEDLGSVRYSEERGYHG